MQQDPTAEQRRRTYRYRLYPTAAQVAALEVQLGACCDLYNAALEQRKRAWRDCGYVVSRYEQEREVTVLRKTDLLPKGMNSNAQRSALIRLDRAMQAFFRRVQAGEKPEDHDFVLVLATTRLYGLPGMGRTFRTSVCASWGLAPSACVSTGRYPPVPSRARSLSDV